jgi:hypothetical protein
MSLMTMTQDSLHFAEVAQRYPQVSDFITRR